MSKVIIKNFDDIAKIRKACDIWKITKRVITEHVKPGISLLELDQLARDTIIQEGAEPAFFNKYGFQGNICISVNECVIHGVPSNYVVKENDKISFDVGVTYQSHVCDSAFTVIVGDNPEAEKISKVCLQAIYEACDTIKPNVSTNMDIAKAIQKYVTDNGYYILKGFTGHGCGNELHEDPVIPNYLDRYFKTCILKPNMVICIEPMILTGSEQHYIDPKDGWSVIARNKKMTCHWEHMVLITEDGFEILTGEN